LAAGRRGTSLAAFPAVRNPSSFLGLAVLALVALSSSTATAQQRGGRPQPGRTVVRRPGPPIGQIGRQLTPQEAEARARRQAELQLFRRLQTERREANRARGQIFERIARGDWRGEYVLLHNADVTAFADISDPSNAAFDPDDKPNEEELETIPLNKRAHILVVPNVAREHIGRSLGGRVTPDDLRTVTKVIEHAEKLAKDLGIVKPRVYINSENMISVGYLHVHILGERPAGGYPPALNPQPLPQPRTVAR
jgi:diadenosine tetraphosphate (Ap4A) HIT family hydrolase